MRSPEDARDDREVTSVSALRKTPRRRPGVSIYTGCVPVAQGWGVTQPKAISLNPLFSQFLVQFIESYLKFFEDQKTIGESRVHSWRVSPQLSGDDTCQLWQDIRGTVADGGFEERSLFPPSRVTI